LFVAWRRMISFFARESVQKSIYINVETPWFMRVLSDIG
jgi:hypothetical protein